jgi:hypothetical protein
MADSHEESMKLRRNGMFAMHWITQYQMGSPNQEGVQIGNA